MNEGAGGADVPQALFYNFFFGQYEAIVSNCNRFT